jgi:flavin-dependent dehydrogenase
VRWIQGFRFEAETAGVDVQLFRPVAIAARRELDGWLLRRAIAAGATHVSERVVDVAAGKLRTAAVPERCFDLVVGADGAGSLVRRTFLGPTPTHRLMMATGWFARGDAPALVRFTADLKGYLWLFPRTDHVGVGICGPLAEMPTRRMLDRLEREVARSFPALSGDAGRYAHTIPSPSEDPRSILESAGDGWVLIGDAAALADPITGEGIHSALCSAALLAATLREGGSTRRYAERLLEELGRDLLKAAAIRRRFYSVRFQRRMIAYAARSRAIRNVLADLVLGKQGYRGLKRRLLGAAPRFLYDSLRSLASPKPN